VAVISDDPLARAGLVALLEAEGIAVVPSSSRGDAPPDVAAVDVAPEGALEALRALHVPAVALLASDGQAADALAAGARGLLARGAPGAQIAAALAAVAHGLLAVDAALGPEVLRPLRTQRASGAEELTAREAQVLSLLAEGLSNKEIARRLGVAERTAKFHVESILGKLGARSRSEAVVRAARAGLVVI
jgi:two-component system, NarL family, nitrate/nitrite response regulator NarL